MERPRKAGGGGGVETGVEGGDKGGLCAEWAGKVPLGSKPMCALTPGWLRLTTG